MNQKSNTVGARRNRNVKNPGFSRPEISLENSGANNTIKVFVGTHRTQGQRASDFCWTHDGEPLYLGFECDSDREPDDRCGCHRSFCGMSRHTATTTAEVVEYTDGLETLVDVYLESQRRAGWLKDATSAEVTRWAAKFRRFIASIQKFPVGAVVEKRGEYIQVRQEKA